MRRSILLTLALMLAVSAVAHEEPECGPDMRPAFIGMHFAYMARADIADVNTYCRNRCIEETNAYEPLVKCIIACDEAMSPALRELDKRVTTLSAEAD